MENKSKKSVEDLLSDARMSYFKRGISEKSDDLLKQLVLVFAEKYFCEFHGEKKRKEVWEELVKTERIEGIRFDDIKSPNDNQLVGLIIAARAAVENPIYELKSEYQYIKAKSRLAQKMGLDLKNEEIDKSFPKISIVHISSSDPSPFFLKQKVAEKAIESLKRYLKGIESQRAGAKIALTGGTSTLRFMNKFLSELDKDYEFRNNMKKLSPINVVEISNPAFLANYGLLENNRSLHLALRDLNLANAENYTSFIDLTKSLKKNRNKEEEFQAIYTGIGKPSDDSSPESNSPLYKDLKEKKDKKYLFEVNAIPYYEDKRQQEAVRKNLGNSILPLENLNSKFKVILCPGGDKAKAIYNLIVYQLRNPSEKIATHIFTDNITFSNVMKAAENVKKKSGNTGELEYFQEINVH